MKLAVPREQLIDFVSGVVTIRDDLFAHRAAVQKTALSSIRANGSTSGCNSVAVAPLKSALRTSCAEASATC